jgi:hypothetical protein
MSAEDEVELFAMVPDELGPNEVVNQAIEIKLAEAEAEPSYELVRYDLPEPGGERTCFEPFQQPFQAVSLWHHASEHNNGSKKYEAWISS